MAIPTQFATGAFIPTTTIYDVSEIYEIQVTDPAFKELIVRLYQSVANISQVLNVAEKGYYVRNEFVTGSLLFPNPANTSLTPTPANARQGWRNTILVSSFPATGTLTIPHLIPVQPAFTFFKIYGTANLPSTINVPMTGSYLPVPYLDVTTSANNIQLRADNTNIYITTGGTNYSAYTGTVILEYIKS